MSECSHDCSSCGENCSSRTAPQVEAANSRSHIGKVIAVVSGKGGVGKSLVTSLLAVNLRRSGKRSAILDADVTGPSIPSAFGIEDRAVSDGECIIPCTSRTGIPVMSVNLLLDNATDPVVWRGPVIAGVVKQFWSDVAWGDIDCLFIDMPPGTGDVPLTVFQSLPVDGIIIVTSPQDLVSMIVEKAVNMAELMKVPVLGIVENMSYFVCPSCGEKHEIFGHSRLEEIATRHGIGKTARIPMAPELAALCDDGRIEDYTGDWLNGFDTVSE